MILINSHSNPRCVTYLKKLEHAYPWVSLVNSSVQRSLKDALWTGWNSRDRNFVPDVVQITETDAVPTISTLLPMLKLFFEEEDKQVGSVTPMYKWQGSFCYPTHNHWHNDPLYKRHPHLGPITNVGGCGVPFLYSLWRPNLIEYINKPQFKELIHLDRDFGNHIHQLGYKHLRMKNYSVDHHGGGRKSRG